MPLIFPQALIERVETERLKLKAPWLSHFSMPPRWYAAQKFLRTLSGLSQDLAAQICTIAESKVSHAKMTRQSVTVHGISSPARSASVCFPTSMSPFARRFSDESPKDLCAGVPKNPRRDIRRFMGRRRGSARGGPNEP